MNVRQKVMIATAVSVIGLTGMAGMASAKSDNGTLVDKLAQKFNLNKDDVQKVFDQEKSDRQAQRETNYEARLTQAVKDGKLTEDQKNKILAKHKELVADMQKNRDAMKAERDSMKDKTDAERQALRDQKRAEMDKKRDEITAWEKANNIPSGYLMGEGRGGHGPGPDGPM